MAEIKPAYLIAGDDEAKIARARRRLRARAERDGGPGALELFEAGDGRRAPDAEALLGSLAAISLTASHRYLLADGVEGWGKKDTETVAEALAAIPPDTTVVLVAHGKTPPPLKKAVEKAGGDLLTYEAPREREIPKLLVGEAKELGFTLELDAARMLVDRLGPRPLRLRNELERLALWSEGGRVGAEQIHEMITDTSEEAIWSLADAIVEGDEAQTLSVAESLVAQGEALPRIIYSLAPRLRQALKASRELEEGRPPKDVAGGLSMHPYAAKLLVEKVRGRSPADIDHCLRALADLEVDSRGGSDYEEGVAFTLALRTAVRAA
jgi:DNA polymerase III subunit delta